ncbi:DUF7261 family protein [Haloarchaeobius iranensis]|uniref:Uncharacterized protein n=1 Tax=Haloarchaeobius iranensis TaxID=996166 RepID=A0A1G9WHN1_9EURY|nr:hypothetical protein [Haloarchaeobius iranensis]SDM83847.1 hypothetical protein SAMN05192554_10870 [Haloarchaeobius iranensis]
MVGIDDDPSRGQIVLVGALAIAFIVLGIVVVFNTSLYAENVDSTGTVSSVNQAEQVRHAGGDSVAGVAYRVNQGEFDSNSTVAAAVNRNTSNFSAVWQSLYAQSQPSAVNASLDGSNSEYGVRVFQSTDDDFRARADAGQENWNLTPSGASPTYSDVGEFDVTLDRGSLDTTRTGAFHLAALGGDGTGNEAWRVVWFVNDSSRLDVYVASGSDPTAPSGWENQTGSQVCNDVSVGTDIEVDMVNGSIDGTSCSFEFTDDLSYVPGENGYAVQFVNGDNATGQYDAHLSQTAFTIGSPVTGGPAPYYSHIVWEASVVVEYDSPTASYTRTVTVPVYNSTR